MNARTFHETAYYLAFLEQQILANIQVSQLMRTANLNSWRDYEISPFQKYSKLLLMLSMYENEAKKKKSQQWLLLHLIHGKSVSHQQLLDEPASDCSSTFLITGWWMFSLKISCPLLIAAGRSVCQLWKYSISQAGRIAYCNLNQMQTFSREMPTLGSICSTAMFTVLVECP